MEISFADKKEMFNRMFSPFQDSIFVDGVNNIPSNGVNIFVPNHCSIMDVFLISNILPNPCVSVVSATTMFGSYHERKKVFEQMLYPFPMEVRAGEYYTGICMKELSNLLINGVSLIMFPQGVFDNGKVIARARTGLARILFDCLEKGVEVNVIPIALDISNIREDNILSTDVWNDFSATVHILPKFSYKDYYVQYTKEKSKTERNKVFHDLMDQLMIRIAETVRRPFSFHYNPLYRMDGFWFPMEKFISFEEGNNHTLYQQYYEYVHSLMKKYLLLNDDSILTKNVEYFKK